MAFTQVHDEWMRQGLVDATFALHVIPTGKGSRQWGRVQERPVDVYYCDFEQYDPPDGFPKWEVCCIRTAAAWWVVLTQPFFLHVQALVQNGDLLQDLYQTITHINERHIGAWLLVQDQGLSRELALAQMDQRLDEKYGKDFQSIKAILNQEASPEDPEEAVDFAEDDFGKEPLDEEAFSAEVIDFNQTAPSAKVKVSTKIPRWLIHLHNVTQKWNLPPLAKPLTLLMPLIMIVAIEGPRVSRLYRQVYGPRQVDLRECFPAICWTDLSENDLLKRPAVSRALHQAIVWRNPVRAATPILKLTVRKLPSTPETPSTSAYQWTVVCDEIAQLHTTQIEMHTLSRNEMHSLQNMISGYKNLSFILSCKLILMWGSHGRFLVLCLGLCLGGYAVWVKRVMGQVQRIEVDARVRNYAASNQILESVARDPQAAENLMLFNQDRRLRMQDQGAANAWEEEAFDWIEQNVDPDSGQTRRNLRDDTFKQTRQKNNSD